MSVVKFQIVGSDLVGAGLSFEIASLIPEAQPGAVEGRKDVLVNIADVVYREGRSSVLLSYDDRFALHNAVETLRGLAVIVGPIAGDRHRRASDIIARLLQDHEGGSC